MTPRLFFPILYDPTCVIRHFFTFYTNCFRSAFLYHRTDCNLSTAYLSFEADPFNYTNLAWNCYFRKYSLTYWKDASLLISTWLLIGQKLVEVWWFLFSKYGDYYIIINYETFSCFLNIILNFHLGKNYHFYLLRCIIIDCVSYICLMIF